MTRLNGHSHSSEGPLHLTPKQRHEILAKLQMQLGWLLLTRAEMNGMRDAMNACQLENDRLTKEVARLTALVLAKPDEDKKP